MVKKWNLMKLKLEMNRDFDDHCVLYNSCPDYALFLIVYSLILNKLSI